MSLTIPNSAGSQYILYRYHTKLSWDTVSDTFSGIHNPGVLNVEASVVQSGNYPVTFTKLDLFINPSNEASRIVKMSITEEFDIEIGTPDSINKLFIVARYYHVNTQSNNAVTFHVVDFPSTYDIKICKLLYSGTTFVGISTNESDINMSSINHSGISDNLFTIGQNEITPIKLKNYSGELYLRNYEDSSFSDMQVGNLIVNGDLTIEGTTTTVNTETLTIEDNIILLNSNETGFPSLDSGIEVNRGTENNVKLFWDESETHWSATNETGAAKTIVVQDNTAILSGTNVTGSGTFNSDGNITINTSISGLSLDGHDHDDLYLNKTNITSYTPTLEYHPATKKYIDDSLDNYMDFTTTQTVTAGTKTFGGETYGSTVRLVIPVAPGRVGTVNGEIWIDPTI